MRNPLACVLCGLVVLGPAAVTAQKPRPTVRKPAPVVAPATPPNPLATILGAAPQTTTPLFRMESSSDYHLASCPLAKSHPLHAATVDDIGRAQITPCPVCHPDHEMGVRDAVLYARHGGDLVFVADRALTIVDKPAFEPGDEKTATVVHRMVPLEIAVIITGADGWIRVAEIVGDSQRIVGWVKGSRENLVVRQGTEAALILLALGKEPWPVATKFAIVAGRPAVGLTRQQLDLCLGEPVKRTTEETTAGRTDVLTYRAHVVTLKDGVVVRIVSESERP